MLYILQQAHCTSKQVEGSYLLPTRRSLLLGLLEGDLDAYWEENIGRSRLIKRYNKTPTT